MHNAMQIKYSYSASLMHNFWQSDQIMSQKILVDIVCVSFIELEVKGQVKSVALWDTASHTACPDVYCTL